ncbi:hypothetical protein GCM10022207_86550 [Streptomyces lannensis]|uniref:Uncharacterized protein n=1 Tax=Streptomyces lannensis TaxID=766498 RepID=A0ABP7LQ78_9ACTN
MVAGGRVAAHAAVTAAAPFAQRPFRMRRDDCLHASQRRGIRLPLRDLVELCKDLMADKADVFGAADMIHGRRT